MSHAPTGFRELVRSNRERAVELVRARPGLTVAELADAFGWAPVNVWRLVLRPLEREAAPRIRRRDCPPPIRFEVTR